MIKRIGPREGAYVASVFLSAFLLFLLQPMLARMLLPVYGGSPAVWNTCMVFFQILLLGGYAYAHSSLRRLSLSRQAALHGVLLLVSLFCLPHALPTVGGGTANPALSIFLSLAVLAGVPFFALSANSSLTQRWFSIGEFESSADPFWLYAASNAGSLVALLSYPFIVEPAFGLSAQLRYWSFGYGAFVALSIVCMLLARRRMHAGSADADMLSELARAAEVEAPSVTRGRRLAWVVRSAVASSLLLSITMEISTDVVSAPLFWVFPLALYLVTFIIAFSPAVRIRRQAVAYATTIGIALCFVLVIIPTTFPLWFALLTLLGTLFAGALLCNRDIADDRPRAAHLTEFYLWIAVGGMVGGVLNSLVAPVVFKSLAEYPLTLVCLALVVNWPPASAQPRVILSDAQLVILSEAKDRFPGGPILRSLRSLRMTVFELITYPPAIVMILATVGAALAVVMGRSHPTPAGAEGILHWQFMPIVVLICGVLFRSMPGTFPLAAALTAAFMLAGLHFLDPIIDQGRSFFGISRVTENATQRIMIHGVTVHGSQLSSVQMHDIPTSYYYPRGPLGWVVLTAPPDANIGVIGLGAGSLAPLSRAGQRLTYYEIDPLVEEMAKRDFSYLADSRASVAVRIGDGRQLIAQSEDGVFDLLIVDAFSGDAIPTHLLTDEAIALYLRKLKPRGLLVMHISNRYADLTRVFRGWQRTTGQRVAINQFVPSPEQLALGVRATVAVAMGRSPAALAPLATTQQWFWLDDDGPAVHWTDDHVNLLAVIDRNVLKP